MRFTRFDESKVPYIEREFDILTLFVSVYNNQDCVWLIFWFLVCLFLLFVFGLFLLTHSALLRCLLALSAVTHKAGYI